MYQNTQLTLGLTFYWCRLILIEKEKQIRRLKYVLGLRKWSKLRIVFHMRSLDGLFLFVFDADFYHKSKIRINKNTCIIYAASLCNQWFSLVPFALPQVS